MAKKHTCSMCHGKHAGCPMCDEDPSEEQIDKEYKEDFDPPEDPDFDQDAADDAADRYFSNHH